jgi:prepilin-type N-terminal cleavage/methylation domain-containing protein
MPHSGRNGFRPSRRSAEHGFTPSWRSAEHGFTPSWRSAEHGFTLVEVLVALIVTSMILAIVMNAALQAKTRGLAALGKEEAVMLAGGLIADRSVAPFDPRPRAGEQRGLRWSVDETAIAADPRGILLLSEIKVSVSDARGVALSSLQLRKIKAAPQP